MMRFSAACVHINTLALKRIRLVRGALDTIAMTCSPNIGPADMQFFW